MIKIAQDESAEWKYIVVRFLCEMVYILLKGKLIKLDI